MKRGMADPHALVLGGDFPGVSYVWRPYEERDAEHRADYDRLLADIERRGIVNPLVVYRGHVLIGQRRCEIARLLGIERVPVVEIDDPSPVRAEAARAIYEEAMY